MLYSFPEPSTRKNTSGFFNIVFNGKMYDFQGIIYHYKIVNRSISVSSVIQPLSNINYYFFFQNLIDPPIDILFKASLSP